MQHLYNVRTSDIYLYTKFLFTKMHAISCVKDLSSPEIYTTSYHIRKCKLGTIRLSLRGLTKAKAIIGMIRPRTRFPARQLVETNFGLREAQTNLTVAVLAGKDKSQMCK